MTKSNTKNDQKGAQLTTSPFEPMTVERLRKHLFGGPQVPFWDYDPAKLTVGVEVEYFIAKVHGDSFTLAKQAQYLAVIGHLVRDFGYQDRNLPDQPGRVSRDTERGFIAIKPDYAWHILEISFPPRRGTDELRPLLTRVLAEVDAALAREGLERLDLSCLPEPPAEMDLVRLDRLALIDKTFHQKVEGHPTIDPNFPAYLTATHIHLNAASEEAFRLFPALYDVEPLAMTLYCRAHRFAGRRLKNARTELYADTLGRDYPLHNIPHKIPAALSDLVDSMNTGRPLFPNDRFHPIRDMSYVRPSKYGTLEFRSACSYPSTDALLEIALWRKVQMVAASVAADRPEMPLTDRLTQAMTELSHVGECQRLLCTIREKVRWFCTDQGGSHAVFPA